MNWLAPKRATEATTQQLVATGAYGGYGSDPIDGDFGYQAIGSRVGRPMPWWTLEKLRAYSVAAYRSNPMARAIFDTYTAFCVGDSGLSLQCTNPDVAEIAQAFWKDPKNKLSKQDAALRSHMLNGETVYEMMVGPTTGVVRRSIIDPSQISGVLLENGNPLIVAQLAFRLASGETETLDVVQVDDLTGLRTGEVQFWTSWGAQETDVRGEPFLSPVIDWLDNYDMTLANLIDRTALMRYMGFHVTMDGADDGQIEEFLRKRGGAHVPRSGTIEVTNEKVHWAPLDAKVGADEDTVTSAAVLTNVAAGAGLAKTWLADPEHANRATSLTMAEPVRRRVGGVQNLHLDHMTELVRFAVDQAVRAGRLAAKVDATDVQSGRTAQQVPAADTVHITGPEIAAADAQITATILFNMAQGLVPLVEAEIMTKEAATVLAKKAWEEFAGIPYTADLDKDDGSAIDDVATEIDKSKRASVVTQLVS